MVLKEIRKMKFTVIFMTILFLGGLLAAGCTCNKGEESEKAAETQKTETQKTETQKTEMQKTETQKVETQKAENEAVTQETPAPVQPTPAPDETSENHPMKSHKLPPEITEPCDGLDVGDACTVIITGGTEINGKCVRSTVSNVLACMPQHTHHVPVQ
jgi:hemolysin activation/secretion protein